MTPEERAWLNARPRSLRWFLVFSTFATGVYGICLIINITIYLWLPGKLVSETEAIVGLLPYLGTLQLFSSAVAVIGVGVVLHIREECRNLRRLVLAEMGGIF